MGFFSQCKTWMRNFVKKNICLKGRIQSRVKNCKLHFPQAVLIWDQFLEPSNNFILHNQIWNNVTSMNEFCFIHGGEALPFLRNLNILRNIKWEKWQVALVKLDPSCELIWRQIEKRSASWYSFKYQLVFGGTGSVEGTTCWYLEELGQYDAVLIGTWLHLFGRGRHWLIFGGTGSV